MSTSSSSVLNDLRSYSRHWLSEFIDLYQTEECLWQPKHPDYSNHAVRNKAYDKLVEKLKEVEPNPDRAMVVRKINSLRSAFRREYRKTSSKNNYETRLWYYEKLLFIADQHPRRLVGHSSSSEHLNYKLDKNEPKRSLGLHFDEDDTMVFDTENEHMDASSGNNAEVLNNGAETVTVNSADCVTLVKNEELAVAQQHQHHHQQHAHEQQLHLQHHQHAQGTPGQQHTAVKVLEITSLDSNSQREIQQAVSSLEQHQMQQQQQQATSPQLTQIHHQQMPTIQIAREHLQPLFTNSATYTTATSGGHRQEDEYDAIGINVASKLRVMNPTQRIIAEKLISDVLFNGQLDSLSVHSTLTQ